MTPAEINALSIKKYNEAVNAGGKIPTDGIEACRNFRLNMAELSGYGDTSDPSKSAGSLYAGFLSSVGRSHQANLTKSQIQDDKSSPCYSKEEKGMLDFTEKHFSEIADLSSGQDAGKCWGNTGKLGSCSEKKIGVFSEEALRKYPEPVLDDDQYRSDFENKAAWVGAAIGTAAEIGACIFAAPVAVGMVAFSPVAGVAGFLLTGGDVFSGLASWVAAGAAWGPIAGAFAGQEVAKFIEKPYWNMTTGHQTNKLFKDMSVSIPTYAQYKAGLGNVSH